jgi:hypothetical protein
MEALYMPRAVPCDAWWQVMHNFFVVQMKFYVLNVNA